MKRWVSFGCGPEKVGIARVETVVPTFSTPTWVHVCEIIVKGIQIKFIRSFQKFSFNFTQKIPDQFFSNLRGGQVLKSYGWRPRKLRVVAHT